MNEQISELRVERKNRGKFYFSTRLFTFGG